MVSATLLWLRGFDGVFVVSTTLLWLGEFDGVFVFGVTGCCCSLFVVVFVTGALSEVLDAVGSLLVWLVVDSMCCGDMCECCTRKDGGTSSMLHTVDGLGIPRVALSLCSLGTPPKPRVNVWSSPSM